MAININLFLEKAIKISQMITRTATFKNMTELYSNGKHGKPILCKSKSEQSTEFLKNVHTVTTDRPR